MLETFDSDPQSPDIDCRTTLDVVQIAHDAAHMIDACSLLESILSGATDRVVKELELPADRSHAALARFLDQLWRGMESRPFVHVVWRRHPEEILHVGSRRDADDRWSSAALFGALQQDCRIALVIPPPSAAATVSDIEAALVFVLGRRNAPGERGRAPERVPGAVGSAHLAEIGRLLGELASKFRVPVAAMPEVPG